MLDKSIPFQRLVMRLHSEDAARLSEPCLPEAYHLRAYRPGDALSWARIETAVLEFDRVEDALAWFNAEYLPFEAELARRMMFVCDTSDTPVATATAWYAASPDLARPLFGIGRQAQLHWVACHPAHQKRGLGRAVVTAALLRFEALEPDRDVFLQTQSYSHDAIALYRSLGFRCLRTTGLLKRQGDGGTLVVSQWPGVLEAMRPVVDGAWLAALEAEAEE